MIKYIIFYICILIPQIGYSQFARESYRADSIGRKGLSEIRFVGTGDIQLALDSGDEIAASTGLGALFWRIWPNETYGTPVNNIMSGMELQLEVKIDVASTTDTVNAEYRDSQISNLREFGSFLLSPISSGHATNVNTVWYIKPKKYNPITGVTSRRLFNIPYIDGVELSVVAANQVWKDSVDAVNVSIIGWRAGIFHEFLPDPLRRQKGYSIRFGANYIGRSIQGDAGRNENFRQQLLINDSKTYHGLEFALTLRLQNIRAEASLPIMHLGATNPVPGLSGAQFVTTISFVGGFPLAINSD